MRRYHHQINPDAFTRSGLIEMDDEPILKNLRGSVAPVRQDKPNQSNIMKR